MKIENSAIIETFKVGYFGVVMYWSDSETVKIIQRNEHNRIWRELMSGSLQEAQTFMDKHKAMLKWLHE